LLDRSDVELILALLKAIDTILGLESREVEGIIDLFDKLGGTRRLENLQMHKNKEVYLKAQGVLMNHHELEEYDEIDFIATQALNDP